MNLAFPVGCRPTTIHLTYKHCTVTLTVHPLNYPQQAQPPQNITNPNLSGGLQSAADILLQYYFLVHELNEKRNEIKKAKEEYEALREKYDNAVKCQYEAESFASKLYAERESTRRQSTMLMQNIGSGIKLMDARRQIRDLKTKLENTKADLESKIKTLEEQAAECETGTGREEEDVTEGEEEESLEKDNSSLLQEKYSLLQKFSEFEKNSDQLRAQYSLLMKRYEELDRKYDFGVPPPPPPLMGRPSSFLSQMTGGGRKKQIQSVGAASNVDISKGFDEMMKRIQQTNTGLRPVLKNGTQYCPEEKEPSAMQELQSILNEMNSATIKDDLTTGMLDHEPTFDANSELGKIFKLDEVPTPVQPYDYCVPRILPSVTSYMLDWNRSTQVPPPGLPYDFMTQGNFPY